MTTALQKLDKRLARGSKAYRDERENGREVMKLALHVLKLRENKKLSRAELAKLLKVRVAQLAALETFDQAWQLLPIVEGLLRHFAEDLKRQGLDVNLWQNWATQEGDRRKAQTADLESREARVARMTRAGAPPDFGRGGLRGVELPLDRARPGSMSRPETTLRPGAPTPKVGPA